MTLLSNQVFRYWPKKLYFFIHLTNIYLVFGVARHCSRHWWHINEQHTVDKNPGPHGTYILVGKFCLLAKDTRFFIIHPCLISLSHCIKPFTNPQTHQIGSDIQMLFSCLEYCCDSDQVLSSPWSLLWLLRKRQTIFPLYSSLYNFLLILKPIN